MVNSRGRDPLTRSPVVVSAKDPVCLRFNIRLRNKRLKVDVLRLGYCPLAHNWSLQQADFLCLLSNESLSGFE